MKISHSIKKPLLVLVVVASFLISGMATVMHQHDLEELPPTDCPVCAASKVLSFADHTLPTLQLNVTYHEVFAPPSPIEIFPAQQLNISHGKNRAPPQMQTLDIHNIFKG